MLTLSEAKQWLKLEEGDTAEDALLQSLIEAAAEYIRNAAPSGMVLHGNPVAGLLARVLVADWYENRGSIGQVRAELLPTVRVLVLQLQAAYPVIETAALPDGTVGVLYSALLAADGGARPYRWEIAEGALPGGLQLDPATGAISGTPTAAGTFSFIARVSDSNVPPKTTTRPLSVTVVTVVAAP